MYKHILIPTDGSEVAEKAIAAGIQYAAETHSKVTLFTAVPEYDPPGEGALIAGRVVSMAEHDRESERKAHEILAAGVRTARAADVDFETDYVQSNQAWRAIVAAAKRNGCDAIVMGSHGRKGISRFVHGSQTVDVLSHCDLPMLVVR